MSDAQDNLIREYAGLAASTVARKTIIAMQRVKATLSGDDSCLNNAWDELCAQIQGEDSFFRDLYDETLRHFGSMEVAKLSKHDLQSLWLQTEAGRSWHWDIEHSDGSEDNERANSDVVSQTIPYDVEDIVAHLMEEYVYPQGGTYTNKRIRLFLDQEERAQYEMDY